MAKQQAREWIVCPRCKGEKTVSAMVCPGFRLVTSECPQCAGSGVLPPHRAEWWKTGNACREYRLSKGITLRRAAKDAGMTAHEYSRQERGMTSPEPIFHWMTERMVEGMGGWEKLMAEATRRTPESSAGQD